MIAQKSSWWRLYIPKLITILTEGYSFKLFRADALAGLTVAIVAIPLAMALAIAAGATPAQGLIAAVIGGFFVSALGGSRVQIGGPSGAGVVIVFNVIAVYGFDGLILTTLMAGAMLIIAGFSRLGTWIRYIPQPVVTGFTTGIAIIIFCSQIRDVFGLHIATVPSDFFEKWHVFWTARDTFNASAIFLSGVCLMTIIALHRYAPSLPAFLIVIIGASLAALGLHLPIATIGSAFGDLPRGLPMPHLPEDITFLRLKELLPSAFTLALLTGIESLLSAVVADGMIDRRHRSNCELVGQGVANVATACFGGMPVTGAITRTITNVRSGATTPVAGILHAVFILLALMLLAPLAKYIPLPTLAVILIVVAWNMAEPQKIKHVFRSSSGEKAVMLITLFLTVAVDLTLAIEVGVVLASILFMHQMSKVVEVESHHRYMQQDRPDRKEDMAERRALPEAVESYAFRGPLFFGVATQFIDLLDQLNPVPKVIILNMEHVPLIDASGEDAIRTFLKRCEKKNIFVIFSGLQPRPLKNIHNLGLSMAEGARYAFAHTFDEAVDISRSK